MTKSLSTPLNFTSRVRATLTVMIQISFKTEDIKFAHLATVYSLGSPGNSAEEIERMKDIRDLLKSDINKATSSISLSNADIIKLGAALNGVINELKQFAIGDGRSMVPEFSQTVEALFPETKTSPSFAMDLIESPVKLKQRLSININDAYQAIEQAQQNPEKTEPRWKFWKKTST